MSAAPEPGIYPDVPMAEYLAWDCVSASGLEVLRRSPLQYRHWLTAERPTSPALDRGTALHLALLEPDLFRARYVVAEPCEAVIQSGKRKDQPCGNPGLFQHRGVGWWVCGVHARSLDGEPEDGVNVIPAETHAQVLAMRDAVHASPRARSMFEGEGAFEVSVVFRDPASGVLCKIRPDRLVERAGMHVALKSARDASERGFQRQAETLGYFRSLALYRRGLKAVGWPYRHTSVLAIEPEPPHDLDCYLVDEGGTDSAMETADAEVAALLHLYAGCTDTDTWPGYNTGGFRLLTRPGWATKTRHEEAA